MGILVFLLGGYLEGGEGANHTNLSPALQNGVGVFEGDVEFVLQTGGDGGGGETLQLGRGFVAEKEGDPTEVVAEFTLASDLYDVIFEENAAVLRDEFEEVFLRLRRDTAVQSQIRTRCRSVDAVSVRNHAVRRATSTTKQLNQYVA